MTRTLCAALLISTLTMAAGDLLPVILKGYLLTMPNVRKFAAATEILAKQTKTDQVLKAELGASDQAALSYSPEQFAAHFPKSATVFREANISARDYILTAAALVQTGMILDAQHQYGGAALQRIRERGNAANLAFFEKNADELIPILDRVIELGGAK